MRALLLFLFTALAAFAQDTRRPEKYARPVESLNIPNLHQVTPQLFRSAQPWPEGFREIEKMGIRTVICLRDDGGDDELAVGTKLKLINVPMGLDAVNPAAVAKVLALLQKKEDGPFLVHCRAGIDRTGVVMAAWRITSQGWTREDAIAEMHACGLEIEAFATWVATADLTKVQPAPPKAK